MLLILAGSIAAAAAADDYASLGDYTFDIPDGFNVTDEADDVVDMELDENHTIVVYLFDKTDDFGRFTSLLELQGCNFTDEDPFQAGNFHVNAKTYEYLDIHGRLYTCEDGKGTTMLIASGIPQSEELPSPENDTARQVVDSLE